MTTKNFILILSAMFFISSCASNSEQECIDKNDSLTKLVAEYKSLDTQNKDLVIGFNAKINEFGKIQDSIKVREMEIAKLKQQIKSKGKATKAESNQLNKMLAEIDGFLKQNSALAHELDSAGIQSADQEQIVKILLTSLEDKQNQINELKTSVVTLQKQVKGLTVDNENLKIVATELEEKTEELEKEKNEIINTAAKITLNDFNIKFPNNLLKNSKKAKNIETIDFAFALNENEFVKSGTKKVYVLITKPNGNLLKTSKGVPFTYNGKTIECSMWKSIEYNNKEKNFLSFTWKKETESLVEGKYDVEIFIDGYIVDNKPFVLEK